MTQSDEKSSSHQSLAANNAALYALPGKQTTTAPEQKTVRREDGIAFGEVNVESIQSCIMCGSHGFEHQRAQQQERDSPWNPQALGTHDLGYRQNRAHFLQGLQSDEASNTRFSRQPTHDA